MPRQLGDSYTAPKNAIPLSFKRTDGDASRRPEKPPTPSDGSVNFYRPVMVDETAAVRWRVEVAMRMAEHIAGLNPNTNKYILADWPEGYAFFDHNKGIPPDQRHDLYLYGSKLVGKFRSVNEFVPHAIWLYRDDPNTPCGCKYCAKIKSQREVSDSYGLPSHQGPPVESSLPVTIRAVPRPIGVPQPQALFSRERDKDIRAAIRRDRRYRIGELVWCRLPQPLKSPARSDLVIDYWPATVMESHVKALRVSGGQSNPREWSVRQSYHYKVQLLGVLHQWDVPEDIVVPYLAYMCSTPMLRYVAHELRPPEPLSKDLRETVPFFPLPAEMFRQDPPTSEPQIDQKPRIVPTLPSFDEGVAAWAVGLQIAAFVALDWGFSDEYDLKLRFEAFPVSQQMPVASTSSANPPPPPAAEIRPVTVPHYQGLWWGTERIWESDLVRLQTYRSSIEIDQLLSPAPKAETRSVFVFITKMFVDPSGKHAKGKVAGPLFELAPEDWLEPASLTASQLSKQPATTNGVLSSPAPAQASRPGTVVIPGLLYPLPPAPVTFRWRRITPPDVEAVLDIALLAGRYYSDVLSSSPLADRLTALGIDSLGSDVGNGQELVTPEQEARRAEIDTLVALAGLSPSYNVVMGCTTYRSGRKLILQNADEAARTALYRHWTGAGTDQYQDVPMDSGAGPQTPVARQPTQNATASTPVAAPDSSSRETAMDIDLF
ncbi:hypothetical protein BKA62DRAFT_688018 [Auriculariales sp. MPI-PUGE-AT-0066]|nr:hypothetical protein BKA62DRAFT_688018 [Auriculariales sp. MPI-PUGE-AT-0066]